MSGKSEVIKDAIKNIPEKKVILYHVIGSITQEDFDKIKETGYFKSSKNALGGQSNGYYFFTTYAGVKHHIETNKDTWEQGVDKHSCILECEVDFNTVKYPNWKLDYEAMQDFMFEMIYQAAKENKIKFDDVEISVKEDDKKLTVLHNGKFSRLESFCANDHSGLVEKTADFLYKHNEKFKNDYDKLLQDVFLGKGDDKELYAVKTTQQQKITKISEIEKEPTVVASASNSQINKFWSRYGKNRQ